MKRKSILVMIIGFILIPLLLNAADAPKDYASLWKLARATFRKAEISPKNLRLGLYDKAEDYAKMAIAADPSGFEGHFYYASSMGRTAEERGVLKSLEMVDPIRKELEKTIALNPAYAPSYHALGILYRKAPGWPISCGDINKAEDYALKAIKYGPELVFVHVGLAEIYIAKGKKDLAAAELKKALSMPIDPETAQESYTAKEDAKSLLKKISK